MSVPTREEMFAMVFPEFSGPNGQEMWRIYEELSNLAGRWRGTQPSDGADAPLHLEIAQEYAQTFQKLTDLGWDWRNIDVESMLPDALMPDVYYETLTVDDLMDALLTQVRWWHQKTARPGLSIFSFDKAYARLLELGFDPESVLKRQNERESSVIWYGIPLSPEKFYERHPEITHPKENR